MSRDIVFAVPGDLATPTGGYAYDRRIIEELKQLGARVDVLDLGSEFPWPSAQTKTNARAQLLTIALGRPIIIDGLAFGVLPDIAAEFCKTHVLIALVHHPLALETGLSQADATAFQASERAVLAKVRHVIATSASTAHILTSDYAVSVDRISVAPPGNDPVAPATGKREGMTEPMAELLAVGSLVPRKGYDVLISALAKLIDLPWRLTIAGDRSRDPAVAAELDRAIARHHLETRVRILGAVASQHLAELYRTADIFVLASRFEGYGMAYAEAIAHGVPVIGTDAGAISQTVPPDAGILVPSDNVEALIAALRRLIEDRGERERLAEGARRAAARLPTWRASAETILQAIEAIA